MYALFVMVGTGGLLVTAYLVPVVRDFSISTVPFSILWLTLPALGFAFGLGLVLNGVSRPFFGWVSDYIGREPTMLIAFLLEGTAINALLLSPRTPRCSSCWQVSCISP